MAKGKFIVIEGSDGSGKSTQFALVSKALEDRGFEVAKYDFPQYAHESSYFVRQYLAGEYGSAESLGAYAPSLFYALDRFEAARNMRADLDAGKVILCDRFVGSNMAHQGQKITDIKERSAYYKWLYDLEFGTLGIPKPDLNIVLLVPAATAKQLIDQRGEHKYNKKDIHETDLGLLERSVATYRGLCEEFPDEFSAVECVNNGVMLSIESVHAYILQKLKHAGAI